jgi:hypothetical protein
MSYTPSLTVTLSNLGATDNLSGLSEMCFSNGPEGPWSSPESYSPYKTEWYLSGYGGNTSQGVKAVYVKYKDAAGNWSGFFSSSIYYQPLQSFPFVDDFSTDKGWFGYELGGWERGPAKAGGATEFGYPDPEKDRSLTLDNYILGYAIGGDYPNNLGEKSIISPPIDCRGNDRVFLRFWRYLNVESNEYDHARVYASNDGANWNLIWENPNDDLIDDQWFRFNIDISDVAADRETVYIKFTMGPTNELNKSSGWNIDGFEVTSNPIDPSEGTIGTEFIISGSNFGNSKGKVLIEGEDLSVAPKVLGWTNEWIHCLLSKVLAPGTYDVTIQPKEPKDAPPIIENNAFTVKAAEIDSIEQGEGTADDQVAIKGKYFGTKKGKVYLECGEEGEKIPKSCKVTKWWMDEVTNESKIFFIVPKMGPEVCDVVVDPYSTLEEVEEEDGFEVKAPEIESVDPKSDSVGQRITISGNYFGSKKGKVYLGYFSNGKSVEKSCSVISWGDDSIVFVVPKGLAAGTYDLIVTNSVGKDTKLAIFTITY